MSLPETPRTWTLIQLPVDARAKLIECVRSALRPLGYAVGVHGSETRDLDLIAAPWVEDAERDVEKITDALRGAGFDELGVGAVAAPHNRLGFALHGIPAAAKVKYIDLSVMLPVAPVDAERERMLDLLERAREVLRRAGVRIDPDCSGRSPLRREIEALLREHDRLQPLMHLWLVSTASFHTFLVRAETPDQARAIAMDGPANEMCCCGAELGYKESGIDTATWDAEQVTLAGDLLHGEPALLDFFS